MKKFLFSLILFISAFYIKTYAQQADSLQTVVDSLTVKVNTLEHQLEYLYLNSKLESLSTNIKLFIHDVQIDYIKLTSFVYNKNLCYALITAYRESYNAYTCKKEAVLDLKHAIKESMELQLMNPLYSDQEHGVLTSSYNTIERAYELLDKSLVNLNSLLNICEKNY